MLKIVKFGGSSLADAGQFIKVKNIIEADANRRYVVPSAPGKRFSGDVKVTDMLYDCYEKASAGSDFRDNLIRIRSRYESIIQELKLTGISLKDEFTEIEEHLRKAPMKDYIASRGEYLNGLVLAAYLGISFIDAADVIFFREDGTFDERTTQKAMKEKLAEFDRAVIPGFYGSMPDHSVKTFSRGGSDITGSIVAAAAHADVYENWTDVSGFMIADPRIVDNPAGIETITYRELRELSYMGASVLHDEAIFPVRNIGIPINIRNTNAPDDEGTWIVESTAQKSGYVITGIAGKKGFCAVDITKSLMNSEIGFGRKVLQAFEENGISFEHMPSGIDTMTIVVHEDEFIEKEQRVVSAIHRLAAPDSIEIESDIALIAVVGRGMRSVRGTAGRIFSALAHAQVNVRMIDQGSSELNIIIGVENRDFENAIRAIYDIFVTTQL
ncbi:MAG: aspartate kinase [Lachnospiraceae bacterium]|nr:aspartate kinase [Lachnospiraceae bacterium]